MTLTAALAILRRVWWSAPLALALAWGLRVDSLRATYKAKWQAVSAEYAAFKVAIIDKTAEALAAQKAVNQAKEAEYQEKAREADQKHRAELSQAMAAAERHIAAHRVLRQAGGGSASGGACSSAENDGPTGADRSGADAELVAVTADDVRICTVNTQRLLDGREWAVGLENKK